MMTSIFILQCLIILLIFGFFNFIYNNEIKKSNEKNKINNNNIISDKELDIFRSGLNQTWMVVNISLYKMYTELEILDYDSIHQKLQQTLEDLTKDQKKMEEWALKYNEYMKDQNKL